MKTHTRKIWYNYTNKEYWMMAVILFMFVVIATVDVSKQMKPQRMIELSPMVWDSNYNIIQE